MFHQSLAQGQLRWEMGPRRIESWNCCWNLVGNPDTRPGSLHHGDTNGNFYAFFGKTMPMISYDSDFNFQNWMRTSMDPWHLCVTSAKNDICTVRFVHGARIKTCSLLLNRDWTAINIPIHPQIFIDFCNHLWWGHIPHHPSLPPRFQPSCGRHIMGRRAGPYSTEHILICSLM